jgi:hypothetical protein
MRVPTKAMRAPSGDQTGKSARAVVGTSRRPVPSASATTSLPPDTSAISVPSGDHAGEASQLPAGVRERTVAVATSRTRTSLREVTGFDPERLNCV